MSNQNQPADLDRVISHVLVGLAVGAIVSRKAGKWGFLVGALASAVAHELLDAPVAGIVAEFTP